ncbi:MAG TPA: hypothetical protein VHH73_16740, partial [Verrucomicrobiae bacterium]|nr:hypothetical protein [Verrucomicrobiae bacterium]
MSFGRAIKSGGLQRLALGVAGCVLTTWVAVAADTIEVVSPDKLKLPDKIPSQESSKQPFDFVRPKGSSSGIVEPLPMPAPTPGISNQRLLDLFDKKKNWMFSKPGDEGPKNSLNSLFSGKGRENEMGMAGGQNKKSIEKFLSDNDRQLGDKSENSATNKNSGDFGSNSDLTKDRGGDLSGNPGNEDSKSLSDRPFRDANGHERDGLREPGRERPGSLTPMTESGDTISMSGGPEARFGIRLPSKTPDIRQEQQTRMDRLNQLFDTPGGSSAPPLSGPFDPINLRGDSTMMPANPVFPTKSADLF